MGYFISLFRGAEYLLHSLNMVFLDVHIKQSTSIQTICIINNLTQEKRRCIGLISVSADIPSCSIGHEKVASSHPYLLPH